MHLWLHHAHECDQKAREVRCEITRKCLLRNAQLWRDMARNLSRFRHRAEMQRIRSNQAKMERVRSFRRQATAQEGAR